MSKPIKIFDTTLRDGTQGEEVCFSADDKLRIAQRLDALGFHYIEGGWPGSNPRDKAFFEKAAAHDFNQAKIVAFGSTARPGGEIDSDPNLNALLEAETPAVSIFGKSWMLHVKDALGITADQNVQLIYESIKRMKECDREVIYDAEHFFDGYKDDPNYAVRTLEAARQGGADVLVLCDTNGGMLPHEIQTVVTEISRMIDAPLGIHTHNDGELAVANSIAAVQAGCEQVQGTINGYGERCGNANLCSVIPNLQFKLGMQTIPEKSIEDLTKCSRFVSELANLHPNERQPYTGNSAFAHKGGIHVSAVLKTPRTYEHIEPETVGNKRRVLVSDLSGKSNLRYKADELGIDLDAYGNDLPEIVQSLKEREYEGYAYEAAEASLNLLIRKITDNRAEPIQLEGFRLLIEKNENNEPRCEATIRVNAEGTTEHTAAEGNGPVHALDQAFRKALIRFFPEIEAMRLQDYKVRVLNENSGTAAKVRVLIDSTCGKSKWSTVGVSENIIEASWEALVDSYSYFLQHVMQSASSTNQTTIP